MKHFILTICLTVFFVSATIETLRAQSTSIGAAGRGRQSPADDRSSTAIPRVITYQGVLRSEGGALVNDGEYTVTMRLYSDEAGTKELWRDTYKVQVVGGVFNIALGAGIAPLPDAATMDRRLWLSTQIGGDPELRPFSTFTASPYALNVPDASITSQKMGTDYVKSISVNGQKISGQGKEINLVTGDGIQTSVDPGTSSILLSVKPTQGWMIGHPPGSQKGVTPLANTTITGTLTVTQGTFLNTASGQTFLGSNSGGVPGILNLYVGSGSHMATLQSPSSLSSDAVATLPSSSGTLLTDSRTITAGDGLTGGGNLSANRTISLDLAHSNTWTADQYFVPDSGEGNNLVAALNASTTALSNSVLDRSNITRQGNTFNGPNQLVKTDGSNNLIARGNILPAWPDSLDLGSDSLPWRNLVVDPLFVTSAFSNWWELHPNLPGGTFNRLSFGHSTTGMLGLYQEWMSIAPATGNVGIGITSPGVKLDVGGPIRFFGPLLPGGLAGGPNQVLTSTGGGTPVWGPVLTSSNDWHITGNINPSSSIFGTLTPQDVIMKSNGITVATLKTSGSLDIPATNPAGPGIITQNNVRLIHSFGTDNFFAGRSAGNLTLTGMNNTFVGVHAGEQNAAGLNNSFFGNMAGYTNAGGSANTFIGVGTGQLSTSGDGNTFSGYEAGSANIGGTGNTFSGWNAGSANTNGGHNTFSGTDAGMANTTGMYNTVLGNSADFGAATLTNATAVGAKAFVAQDNSLVLGSINTINGATQDTRVGIGTTMPSQKLEVKNGNILLSSTGSAGQLQFGVPSGPLTSSFEASLSQTLPIRYILPPVQPAGSTVLTDNGFGILSWQDPCGLITSCPGLTTLVTTLIGSNAWLLTGNASTIAGTNFVGTTDPVAFEIHVNNAGSSTGGYQRVMLYEPNATSANIIGGYNGNSRNTLVVGATISGGGASGNINKVTTDFGTIGGGSGNTAGDGGVHTGQLNATVSGGQGNTASGRGAAVGGGEGNTASGLFDATVAGGHDNLAQDNYSTVGGGQSNWALALYSTVSGGTSNRITSGTGEGSVIGGGIDNRVIGQYSAIPGGRSLRVGDHSFGFNGTSSVTDISSGFNPLAYFGNVDLWLGNVDATPRAMRFYTANTSLTYNAATTTYTAFKASNSQTGNLNITYTLPPVMGTANTVLTDVAGNGILSWQNPCSLIANCAGLLVTADNGLTKTANNIQLGGPLLHNTGIAMNGNDLVFAGAPNVDVIKSSGWVGIGTGSPSQPLQVVGNMELDGAFMPGGLHGNFGDILTSTGPGIPVWQNICTFVTTNCPGLANNWTLTGNSGTSAPTNFLGTTDNQAFEIHVNNAATTGLDGSGRVWRFEPMTGVLSSPNIIGGYQGNSVVSSNKGQTIAGGGMAGYENRTTNDFGTVSGGFKNVAKNDYSTVSGGAQNIAGGLTGGSAGATVAGGVNNTASDSYTSIGGGTTNTASLSFATVAGGGSNKATNQGATVGGGRVNLANGTFSTIAGGYQNIVGDYSAIPGGRLLTLGNYSFGFNSVVSASGNPVDLTSYSNVAYFGNVDIWIGNIDGTPHSLKFFAPNTNLTYSGAVSTSFVASALQTSNIPYTLPPAMGAANTVLTDVAGNGILSWQNPCTLIANCPALAGLAPGTGCSTNMFTNLNGVTTTGAASGCDNTGHGYNALAGSNPLTGILGGTLLTGQDNTADGFDALSLNAGGSYNSSTGSHSLQKNTTGNYNSAFGAYALQNNTANWNTAVGYTAMNQNTTGFYNTAIGHNTLFWNTTATNNTAVGENALFSNTTLGADYNTAIGSSSLQANTHGTANTATGYASLISNTIGTYNTATGVNAMDLNQDGGYNTAIGENALERNVHGNQNTAVGGEALLFNTADANVGVGYQALKNNLSGTLNTALGYQAGYSNVSGTENAFFGYSAGYNNHAIENTFVGYRSGYNDNSGWQNTYSGFESGFLNTTGRGNTFSGSDAGYYTTTGSWCTFLGYESGLFSSAEDNNTLIGAYTISFPGVTNGTAIGFNAYVAQSNAVILGRDADVGIGTETPAERLDVRASAGSFGNVRFEGALMPAGLHGILSITQPQVLVSQGANTAPVWQNASAAANPASAVAIGSAAVGSGSISPSASATGNNAFGTVTFSSSGFGPGLVTVTFGAPYTGAGPVVITLTPANAAATFSTNGLIYYYVTSTLSNFTINVSVGASGVTNATFNYMVMH